MDIKKIVRENFTPYISEDDAVSDVANDAPNQLEKTEEMTEENKYERVQNLLNNPVFNHAAIVEHLYGENNATYRSLFGKKLNQDLNDSGKPYTFEDEELSKIIAFLMDTSKVITKSVGRKGSA